MDRQTTHRSTAEEGTVTIKAYSKDSLHPSVSMMIPCETHGPSACSSRSRSNEGKSRDLRKQRGKVLADQSREPQILRHGLSSSRRPSFHVRSSTFVFATQSFCVQQDSLHQHGIVALVFRGPPLAGQFPTAFQKQFLEHHLFMLCLLVRRIWLARWTSREISRPVHRRALVISRQRLFCQCFCPAPGHTRLQQTGLNLLPARVGRPWTPELHGAWCVGLNSSAASPSQSALSCKGSSTFFVRVLKSQGLWLSALAPTTFSRTSLFRSRPCSTTVPVTSRSSSCRVKMQSTRWVSPQVTGHQSLVAKRSYPRKETAHSTKVTNQCRKKHAALGTCRQRQNGWASRSAHQDSVLKHNCKHGGRSSSLNIFKLTGN